MKIKPALLGVVIAGLTSIPVLIYAQQPMQDKGMPGMGQGMGQNMGMMSSHQEMSKLVDQVTSDLAALQTENDLDTIKKKLAADHSLLEQLQNHMQHPQGMTMTDRMKMMDHMKMMNQEGASAK